MSVSLYVVANRWFMVSKGRSPKRILRVANDGEMDYAELARIHAEKKMLEKAGKLPGQKRRTELECIWFFMGKVGCPSPSVLRSIM